MENFEYLKNISRALRKHIDVEDFADSMSETQFRSKNWLIETLLNIPNTLNKKIFIIGGWYGTYLVPMIRNKLLPSYIVFNDKNSDCVYFAECIHGKEDIEYMCFDAMSFTEIILKQDPDIIINTSCEHMKDMDEVVNIFRKRDKKVIFALQTCDNDRDPGHINPKADIDSFITSTNLIDLYFHGSLDLGHKKRFMIVGQT